MTFLTTFLSAIVIVWVLVLLCSLPVLAALMRSSQLSRAAELNNTLGIYSNQADSEEFRANPEKMAPTQEPWSG
jgi:hypothetical protein